MEFTSKLIGDQVVVDLSGHLTFQHGARIKALLDHLFGTDSPYAGEFTRLVFVLEEVKFIDSSGLGMFIVAKERANGSQVEVRLKRPSRAARKMLDIARFGKIFTIED